MPRRLDNTGNWSSSSAAVEVLECEYFYQVDSYICALTIFNPNGFDNFTEIQGTHFTGFNNLDVVSIYATETSRTVNIPKIICDTFKNLQKISYSNGIQEIGEESFKSCEHLDRIILFNNAITSIHESAFSENLKLKTLNLGQNQLTDLPEKLFESQVDLISLNLISNYITDMPNRIFRSLKNLTELDLSRNQLSSLRNDWFRELVSLQQLFLDVNTIEALPADVFTRLKSLTHINLSSNRLNVIKSSSFGNLPKLTKVNLEENKIEAIDEKFIDNTGVTTLLMSKNICSNQNLTVLTPSRTTMKNELKKCFANYEALIKTVPKDFDGWMWILLLVLLSLLLLTLLCFVPGVRDIVCCCFIESKEFKIGYKTRNLHTSPQKCLRIKSIMCSKICSLIFLFGCIQIIFGQQDLLKCDYGSSYLCSLTVSNTGTGFFTDIEGEHVAGRTDSDVIEIIATPLSNSVTVPSVICAKFANIGKTTYIGIGLENIDRSAFKSCRLVKQINLSDNEISTIDELAFSKNGELQRLSLAQNRISSLPTNVFETLGALRQLDISYNLIETLATEWFANLASLQVLYLNSNQIKELPTGVFASLTSLGNINLGRNKIEVLSSESFGELPRLTLLDVKGNVITAVDEKLIDNTGITNLSMDDNECASDDFIDSTPERGSMKQELATCFENFNNIVVTTTDTTTTYESTETTETTTETTTGETTELTTEETTSETTEDTTTEEVTEETTPDSASGIMIGKIILIVGLSMRILLD
ncbi:leucine-rich repeat-containing protein 15-like [Chironomus tepperi]|uniref:leucine-rich repeat-containing protein 15-like n=1 Tax=Chironomus tepperi TaxID=113505 RepID=UPI00391F9757